MKSLIIGSFAALPALSACSSVMKTIPEAKDMVIWYDKPAGEA
ncbi:MAG: hypothetical protein ACOXZQ_03360 [Bacteroidales bacterium]|jgi:hypothetical protein|nr:hypothetical protein [Bacteroidales bacterium]HQL46041.1 hypothetical protein [Bacteroidales bacterium]